MNRAAALFGLLALSACEPSGPAENLGQRAARACDGQFGAGSPASADCQVKIALKAEARQLGDQQREAERRVGQ